MRLKERSINAAESIEQCDVSNGADYGGILKK
jgi:hypothetical protein